MASRSIVASLALSAALFSGNAVAQDEPPMVAVGLPRPAGAPPRGGPLPPPPPTTLRSPLMVGIGAALVVGGVSSMVSGSVLFWLNGRNVVDAALSVHGPDTAAIISGGILILIGIPLIAIGASRVPVGPEQVARFVPRVTPSRGGGALTWAF